MGRASAAAGRGVLGRHAACRSALRRPGSVVHLQLAAIHWGRSQQGHGQQAEEAAHGRGQGGGKRRRGKVQGGAQEGRGCDRSGLVGLERPRWALSALPERGRGQLPCTAPTRVGVLARYRQRGGPAGLAWRHRTIQSSASTAAAPAGCASRAAARASAASATPHPASPLQERPNPHPVSAGQIMHAYLTGRVAAYFLRTASIHSSRQWQRGRSSTSRVSAASG